MKVQTTPERATAPAAAIGLSRSTSNFIEVALPVSTLALQPLQVCSHCRPSSPAAIAPRSITAGPCHMIRLSTAAAATEAVKPLGIASGHATARTIHLPCFMLDIVGPLASRGGHVGSPRKCNQTRSAKAEALEL